MEILRKENMLLVSKEQVNLNFKEMSKYLITIIIKVGLNYLTTLESITVIAVQIIAFGIFRNCSSIGFLFDCIFV